MTATLHQEATVSSSAGEVTGRWWWDESRPWVLYLTVPDSGGGHTVARIGREPLGLALQGLPLAVCRPDVQVWVDTEFAPESTLRIQLNPPPGVDLRTVRWRTCPVVAAEFLAKTQARVAMCLRPEDCKGDEKCTECQAITDRIDVLAARRGGRGMLTLYDEFAGWGGSSQGCTAIPGVELIMAANHDKLAIEVHSLNFPDADHYEGDVAKAEIEKFPRADLFWASPSCPAWSNARGQRRDFDRSTETLPMEWGEPRPDESTLRSRALMEEVPRYLAAMKLRGQPVLAGVVENVVECRHWAEFDRWLREIRSHGYRTRVIALNSMHARGRVSRRAPQSRDRLYVAYWLETLPDPDWDKWLRPAAWCPTCDEWVNAVQVFKRPDVDMGRYGVRSGQYVYRCPRTSCRHQVIDPEARPAEDAIDWTLPPGQRIGDREDPLKPATIARIQAGLDKFTPPFLAPAGGTWRNGVSPLDVPMPTRTTRDTDGLVCGPMLVPTTGRDGKQCSSVTGPLPTQTCRRELGLTIPPFMVQLRGGGCRDSARAITEPLGTFSASGFHHGLVNGSEHLLVPYSRTGVAHGVDEPLRTLTTKDRYGLLGYTQPVRVDDCTFRMLEPEEIARGMAFREGYRDKGSKRDRARGYGNAVTPPSSEVTFSALVEAITGEELERAS